MHTGSAQNIELTLPMMLSGFAGEEKTCDSGLVWITKTSWPMTNLPKFPRLSFQANKCIVLVRNPLDMIVEAGKLAVFGTDAPLQKDKNLHQFDNFWSPFVTQKAEEINEATK